MSGSHAVDVAGALRFYRRSAAFVMVMLVVIAMLLAFDVHVSRPGQTSTPCLTPTAPSTAGSIRG